MESQGFADSSNLIFQTIWKSGVEQVAERAISIVLDLGGKAVEVHDVPCNAVCVLLVSQISRIQEVWFEPLQCHTLEIGLSKSYLSPI